MWPACRGAQEEELLALLKARAHPICYDGFEPSGRMHIAQGILKAINVSAPSRPRPPPSSSPAPLAHPARNTVEPLFSAAGAQVNKLTAAGCVFKFWVADWFAMLNNKVASLALAAHMCFRFFVTVFV